MHEWLSYCMTELEIGLGVEWANSSDLRCSPKCTGVNPDGGPETCHHNLDPSLRNNSSIFVARQPVCEVKHLAVNTN